MHTAVIGAARVVFGADTAEFDARARGIEGTLGRLQEAFRAMERQVRDFGVRVTAGVTAPLALLAQRANATAGDFEAQMLRVQSALQGIDPEKLEALSRQARELGPAMGRSAAETAGGIEALALAGMSATTILNGGLASALKLAAAEQAQVADAGSLANDVMVNFGKSTSQLPGMVNKMSGALSAGKFQFNDYRLAASQAAGVVGPLGMSFDDFNVSIAALSNTFASGSDAGTSFAAMVRAIVNPTDDAVDTMEKLAKQTGFTGDVFKDAQGNLRPLNDMVANLQATVGKLEKGKQGEVLAKLVGGDAMRAALALLQQGTRGIASLREQIDKSDIGDKLAIQMQGSAQATRNIANAWEKLKLAIADTGLLATFTALKNAFAGVLDALASVNPVVMKGAVALGVMAAAIGPLALALGAIAKVGLVLFFSRLSMVGQVIMLLINPIGVLTRAIGGLLVARFAGTAIAALGSAFVGLAGPIGLVVGAIGLFVLLANSSASASADMRKATDAVSASLDAYEEAANAAATATGKERIEALKNAAAKREEARQTIVATRAKLMYAQMDLQQMKLQHARAARIEQNSGVAYADRRIESVGQDIAARRFEGTQQADIDLAEKGLKAAQKRFESADKILQAANEVSKPITIDLADPEKMKKTPKGRNTTYDGDNREQLKLQAELEAARLRNDQATVRALEDRLDRSRQIEAYQRTGLSLAEATKNAERDLKLIDDARAVQSAKEIADDRLRFDLRLAEIAGNGQLRDSLERQEYLQERIDYWLRQRKTLTEATALATAEQVRLDAAIASSQERGVRAAEARRQIDLARARGDSEERIRGLERAADIEERTRALMRGAEGAPMSEAAARARAETEALEAEQARRTGLWRDTIKGGFRAALDGNTGDWLKNWWKDRVAKGMEEALNSLAEKIERLFSKMGDGSGGGGDLLSSFAKLFGGGGGGGGDLNSLLAQGNGNPQSVALPGFKTGGSFKVGGRAGIDRNLVAFRATAGEMVDIRRPGQEDTGPMPVLIHLTAEEGALFRPVVRAEAAGQSVRVVSTERRAAARKARQRLG